MEVSMDGLRKRLIIDYNSLTKKLNNSIKKYDTFNSEIIIEPEDIRTEMDGLRIGLATLAFSYLDGPNGFSSLDEETLIEEYLPENDEERD
jgi:hypothetical protein